MKYLLLGFVSGLALILILTVIDVLRYDTLCTKPLTMAHIAYLAERNVDHFLSISEPITKDIFCNNS